MRLALLVLNVAKLLYKNTKIFSFLVQGFSFTGSEGRLYMQVL
jgi:hypothetical protein